MGWLNAFTEPILNNIIGGTATQALNMGALFLLTILVMLLLTARMSLEVALIIVSPAIIVASFGVLLPPLAFGIAVLLIGLFFAGIILAIAR